MNVLTEENYKKFKEQISLIFDIFMGKIDFDSPPNRFYNFYLNGNYVNPTGDNIRSSIKTTLDDIKIVPGAKIAGTYRIPCGIDVKIKTTTKTLSVNFLFRRWRGDNYLINELFEVNI